MSDDHRAGSLSYSSCKMKKTNITNMCEQNRNWVDLLRRERQRDRDGDRDKRDRERGG